MNWTSRKPIENVKCIVETNTGCVFPAHCLNGTWWNTEKAFPVDGVVRWIVYPEGEESNSCIAPEVLLKYAWREYKEMKYVAKEESEKVKELRKLNKELTEDFNRTYKELMELRDSCAECKQYSEHEIKELQTKNHNLILEIEELREGAVSTGGGILKELLRENKRLKGYLKSFTQICEMANEMEMAV